jgi:hypothetical protein
VHSFEHLSIWSVLLGMADVSANDWRKRLQGASAWLSWLLQEVLAASSAVSPWLVRGGWRRILLIDGTHLSCPGPLGMVWRVHTAFDLLAGRLTQLKVTDRANGLRARIAFVQQQLADLVVRFTPHNLPLEEEDGAGIPVVKWLKGRHAPAGRVCSRQVWISHQGRRIALRWIALRLSQQQREAADTLYLAGWVLLVTPLPGEQWTDQQVLCLYQARWHIELVFKRIKQLLQQHRLRCTTAATAQPTLTALLLGWALLEEESTAVRLAMRDAMHSTQQAEEASQVEPKATHVSWWQDGCTGPLSEWMVAEVSVDLLCQLIRGSYTAARYRACLPRVPRFLCSGHRKRPHLYSQVCRWLGMPVTGLGKQTGLS